MTVNELIGKLEELIEKGMGSYKVVFIDIGINECGIYNIYYTDDRDKICLAFGNEFKPVEPFSVSEFVEVMKIWKKDGFSESKVFTHDIDFGIRKVEKVYVSEVNKTVEFDGEIVIEGA